MATDARRMRGERPFIFSKLKTSLGLPEIIAFSEKQVLMKVWVKAASARWRTEPQAESA